MSRIVLREASLRLEIANAAVVDDEGHVQLDVPLLARFLGEAYVFNIDRGWFGDLDENGRDRRRCLGDRGRWGGIDVGCDGTGSLPPRGR